MEDERPDPQVLLKQLNAEQRHGKGRLKIFFGYAAGVGKTYAMLSAAHSAKKAGIDVVVGYVEPHLRPETLELLEGLEQMPPLAVAYKGITLNEFDLDSALKRKPQLILVDELAHTNGHGCRHTKRYSDIEELISAGIDVYTTVNVQHLESLNDIVASITQVVVKERIPDQVFDEADQIELVDIGPDELIARLNEGKIYRGQQAERALDHFFIRDNLIALREIALRRTADRVNLESEQSKAFAKNKGYYTGEHILTCISGAPSNAKVIRTAARMANAFHGALTALYVETPRAGEMSPESKKTLQDNIKLVEQLGGKVVNIYGDDLAYQIAEFARAGGISKVVMGRSNHRKGLFYTKRNLVDRLTDFAPNLDLYIIPDRQQSAQKRKRNLWVERTEFSWADVLKTAGVLAGVTAIGFWFDYLKLPEGNIINLYILGVLIVSALTNSRIYGLLSSVFSVLIFNFFFTYPRLSLHAYDAGYPVTFAVMLVAALITSTLTLRVKTQARIAALKAQRTEVLLETSQKLQRAMTMAEITQAFCEQCIKLLDKTIVFYQGEAENLLSPRLFEADHQQPGSRDFTGINEQAVAAWVYRNKKPAGVSTDTLPGATGMYLPLGNHENIYAVLGIMLDEGEQVPPFERSLLLAMLNETVFAIEKYRLNEAQKQTSLQAERERLRSNLLRAISHDLRTPLTSISGNASILLEKNSRLDVEAKRILAESIYDDALWLINLVENLLSVTRIDNGSMSINMEPELIIEVIEEALRHLNRRYLEYDISVQVPDDLLMAKVDAQLIIQVIINIVNNAIKYTAPGSAIVLTALRHDQEVVLEIADNGQGISDNDKEKLFDMFFTAKHNKGDSRRGLGLGLSLCQSIIEAHGGKIFVRDNVPKGTVFGFTLQLEEVPGDESNNIGSGR